MHGSKHEKTHTKPFICETCNKGFALRLDLSRHIKTQHRAGNEKHQCNVEHCEFTSTRKDNVRRHKKKAHGSTIQAFPVRKIDATQLPYQQPGVLGDAPLYSVSNLMRVAASGDLDRLKSFLDAGLTVETRADDQSTVLHCSARAGQAEVVKFLLDTGADFEARNEKNRLPIHEAILSDSKETFELLLGSLTQEELRGSELQLRHYFVQSGHIGIINAYLARLGCGFTDQSALEKLKFAIQTGHDKLVAKLLDDPSIDCNYRQGNGYAPIHLAAIWGREKVMKVFLASSCVDKTLNTSRGRQALHLAAIKGHAAIVKQLIHHPSVDVNCRDNHQATPLHYASSNGHTMVVEQLIHHSSVIADCQDRNAATPLHYASSKGHTMVLEQLLSLPSADFNCKDKKGMTMLHHASLNGHTMVIARLIRHSSVDINCQDVDTATPLHYAASNGQWETASFLLKHSEPMKDGCCISSDVLPTSLSFTKEDLLHRLFKRPDFGGPNKLLPGLKTVLHVAAEKGDCEVIEVLLAYPDIDVNVPERNGLTPLMTAAKYGKLEALRLLLQRKDIDVNVSDQFDRTPMMAAARNGKLEVVRMLLQHKDIDVNVPGRSRLTPLMTAAKHGKMEAVKLLLQHKDIDVNQNTGAYWKYTALQYAESRKHNEIVDLLLAHGAIDNRAKAPTTVPATTHTDGSQNTTLQPDDSTHFGYSDDDMDDAPTEAWEEFLDMDEGMEE